jgi:hypothetical protein
VPDVGIHDVDERAVLEGTLLGMRQNLWCLREGMQYVQGWALLKMCRRVPYLRRWVQQDGRYVTVTVLQVQLDLDYDIQ